MDKEKDYQIKYLYKNIPGISGISRLEGDASAREFYRVDFEKGSRIAMVYPRENYHEIQQIIRLSQLFRHHGINAPQNFEVIGHRIILQQDLGDRLLQDHFQEETEKGKQALLDQILEILRALKSIDPLESTQVLDHSRMKGEMNFFLEHYARYKKNSRELEKGREILYALVGRIMNIDRFAHRDFHSRNLLIREGKVFLVDFQDAMQAPRHYDLVSFLFDSYLDLTPCRENFLKRLSKSGYDLDEEQFYLTALQRNIKALGTFGYQVNVRENIKFKKYIQSALNHITGNPFYHLVKDFV
jgi:aminoglycoside/choline kinase family phosphotransferase